MMANATDQMLFDCIVKGSLRAEFPPTTATRCVASETSQGSDRVTCVGEVEIC